MLAEKSQREAHSFIFIFLGTVPPGIFLLFLRGANSFLDLLCRFSSGNSLCGRPSKAPTSPGAQSFSLLKTYSCFLKKIFIFRVWGREGEREGKKYRCERETLIGCLSCAPKPETWPRTQACALARNRTGDLSLCGMTPNPLSHTGWGM